MVRSTWLPLWTWVQYPASMWWPLVICNSSPEGVYTLLWPWLTPGTQAAHVYTCKHIFKHTQYFLMSDLQAYVTVAKDPPSSSHCLYDARKHSDHFSVKTQEDCGMLMSVVTQLNPDTVISNWVLHSVTSTLSIPYMPHSFTHSLTYFSAST